MFCDVFVFDRELLLNNNLLRVLPYELGRLFQLQTLGLKGQCVQFVSRQHLESTLNYI